MDEIPREFPSTRWASVLAARDGKERALHLENLFRSYWTPVFLFIHRTWRKSEEDSRDLTQEFFVDLLGRDFLKQVDPSKGRFRTFIKACLRNFLLDAEKRHHALKRGGAGKVFSLDGAPLPALPAARTPDEAFDGEWISALLRSALPELEKILAAEGRDTAYKIYRALDVDSTTDSRPTYQDLAQQFGVTEQAVKSGVDYARKLLRKIILLRIREYSLTESDASDEMRELFNS